MVAPLAAIAGAATSVAIGELVSGPLSSLLSTVMPHENITIRASMRMIAQGALTPEAFEQLEAVKRLQPEDRAIQINYARMLHDAFLRTQYTAVLKPFVKEQTDILNALDDGTTAKFLGNLDDATKKMAAIETELVRLDKVEKQAWIDGELAINNVLVRIVEDKIKKTAA